LDEIRTTLDDFDLLLTGAASQDLRAALHQQIRAFNDSRSEPHRSARQAGASQLDIYIYDAERRLRGGLVASTYWDWLEIDDLWLDEALRGRGYGRQLMRMAEAEARVRGCRRAWVRTFRFQAPGFYERLGYRVVGVLEDYPPGNALYWMRKDFVGEEAG